LYVQFSDGGAYSKAKMEDAYRAVSSDKPQAKPTKALSALKRDDVDLIVSELEIPRPQAEKILIEKDGDLRKALHSLI
ncbi:hypothetical protein HETIRDRAFT_244339, partial [Heterobasidion irregulare TC 32-1]